MKWDVLNIDGKKIRSVELPDSLQTEEVKDYVLHTVVKGYRANRRQGTHATKTRSMVSGGGKKPFKQKGTGGARQGSTRSPLMPGGATLHGPQPRSYREKLNGKVKSLALKMAILDKVRHGQFFVLETFGVQKYSTKHVVSLLGKIGCENALLSDHVDNDLLYKSGRGIHGVSVVQATSMNAENVLRHKALILSEAAFKVVQERLGVSFEG